MPTGPCRVPRLSWRGRRNSKGLNVIVVWILLAVVVLALIVGVASYNRFVRQKQLIKDAWSNIDTELRRRYDLIPNLVETVKGYASHEKEVFEEVARTRSMAAGATGSPAEQAAAEGPLVAALGKLFAVAEAYPDLKANQNFLALQAELSNTEDRLQTARRFYNANVRDYNQRVKQFPSVVIANMFGFKEEEFFEVDEAVREAGPPQVDFSTPTGTPSPPAPSDAPQVPAAPADGGTPERPDA
jgi:LemA protein